MIRRVFALVLALAGPAAAQTPDVPVDGAGVDAAAGAMGRVIVDVAELRAGPGKAYVSRGRVYQGDEVEILKGADIGGWMEVLAAGGARGWLQRDAVKITPGAKSTRTSRVDEQFTYDDKGRRIGPDGRPIGSGEGARRTETPEDFDLDSFEDGAAVVTPGESTPWGLSVRLGAGATLIRRGFNTNAPADSLLRTLESKPLGYGFDLEVGYRPIDYLAVRALFRDARFTETKLQTPTYNGGQPFGLAVDAQQAELDLVGRFPILDGWVGAYAGGRFWRQGYRQVQPTPLFLTTTWLGLGAGGALGWAFGPVDVAGRGGIVLPFDVSQTPQSSGEADPFGFGASAEVAWSFLPQLAVVGHWHYSTLTTDFTGPATHVDATLDREGPAYSQGQSVDSLHGGGLGVRWTP